MRHLRTAGWVLLCLISFCTVAAIFFTVDLTATIVGWQPKPISGARATIPTTIFMWLTVAAGILEITLLSKKLS